MFLLSNIEQKLIIYIAFVLSKVFCSENVVSESSAVLTEKFGKSIILKQKLQNQFILSKTSRVLALLYAIINYNNTGYKTDLDIVYFYSWFPRMFVF